MTNQEFSNEFDILYNNISSNQAPGLTEYEKSVFLTNAQDNLVLELLTGKNMSGESFEKTEELREYLTNIIATQTTENPQLSTSEGLTDNTYIIECPENLWMIVFESVKFNSSSMGCTPSSLIEVVPVTHDEFARINRNPFRKSNKNRVLRLNATGKLELISDYPIASYTMRYITHLDPIILTDLGGGLSIKNIDSETECKLNPALHEAILGRAVQLAKTSMGLLGPGN